MSAPPLPEDLKHTLTQGTNGTLTATVLVKLEYVLYDCMEATLVLLLLSPIGLRGRLPGGALVSGELDLALGSEANIDVGLFFLFGVTNDAVGEVARRGSSTLCGRGR